MRDISEEKDKDLLDSWKVQAREVTLETLPAFVKGLLTDYRHDYGTIVHATHASMMAAFSAVNKSEQGGLTGFQAGCLGWMLVHDMFGIPKDQPARLLNYGDLVYPQYEEKYTSIPRTVWDKIQALAREKLSEESEHAHPDVINHWRSIASGKVPFGLRVSGE